MSATVQEILKQIDRLDEADRAALRGRARADWEKLAEVERSRSAAEGVTEDDIQQAVNEVRYGGKGS